MCSWWATSRPSLRDTRVRRAVIADDLWKRPWLKWNWTRVRFGLCAEDQSALNIYIWTHHGWTSCVLVGSSGAESRYKHKYIYAKGEHLFESQSNACAPFALNPHTLVEHNYTLMSASFIHRRPFMLFMLRDNVPILRNCWCEIAQSDATTSKLSS